MMMSSHCFSIRRLHSFSFLFCIAFAGKAGLMVQLTFERPCRCYFDRWKHVQSGKSPPGHHLEMHKAELLYKKVTYIFTFPSKKIQFNFISGKFRALSCCWKIKAKLYPNLGALFQKCFLSFAFCCCRKNGNATWDERLKKHLKWFMLWFQSKYLNGFWVLLLSL